MGRVMMPKNDKKRVALLWAVINADAEDRGAGQSLLSQALIDQISGLVAAFEQTSSRVADAMAHQSQTAKQAEAAAEALQNQVRSVWNQVESRVRWHGVSSSVYPYFQLSLQGKRPKVQGGRPAWLHMAQSLLLGEEKAIVAGYPAMLDQETFSAAKDALQAALAARDSSQRSLQQERKARQALRAQANDLCRDVLAHLRIVLRQSDQTTRQAVLRRYGFPVQRSPEQAQATGQERDISLGEWALADAQPEETADVETVPVHTDDQVEVSSLSEG